MEARRFSCSSYVATVARKYVEKAVKLSKASKRSWERYAWIFETDHAAVVNGVAVLISYGYTKLIALDQSGFTFRENRYGGSHFKLAGVLRSIAAEKFKPETMWTDPDADKQFRKLLEGFSGVGDLTPVLSSVPPVAKKVVAALV